MAKKKFVLRVDEKLFKQVEKWADDEFRSVNGQLEWIIHRSLRDARRLPRQDKPRQADNND